MASKFALSGLVLIALAAALGGAYQLGRSNAEPDAASAVHTAALPAGHAAVAAPQREGKVGADAAQKFTHFRVGNKNVKRIHADGAVVWVGTSGGVVRYDTQRDDYKLYDVKNGLLSNGVFFVGKLDDRIAVGTYGGGLALLDPKTEQWETYNVPEGLGDAFVYDVLKTKDGDVWIATWSGVNRIKGGRLGDRAAWELHTVESTKGGLPNDWVYGLAEGKNGEVWLGTEGGLARFAGGKWDNWNHAKGLGAPYERVKDAIDFKTDPAKQSDHHARQKQEMGLADINVAYNPNYIVSLAVDRDGVVWAGTWGGGLSRFDGTTWTQQTVAEGLPGNHVFMLHADPQWRAVDRHQQRPGAAKGRWRLRGHDHATTACSTTPCSRWPPARDGTLWVGSFGGVARIKSS